MKSTTAASGVELFRTATPILAADEGNLPSKIEILKQGTWDTPYHGMFEVTLGDLQQYIKNFNGNVRAHSSSVGLPIDPEHKDTEGALGWIKKLYLASDSETPGQESLWGDIEWSAEGKRDLHGKKYKFFSPTFWPVYSDPEGRFETQNVLEGGALTTKPLFKGLNPVMASEKIDDTSIEMDGGQTIHIKASNKELADMTLEEIRKKDASTLTEKEREFLADNKAELTADELKTYGFEEATQVEPAAEKQEDSKVEDEAPAAEATPAETPAPAVEPVPVAASDSVRISASELNELKATAAKFETKEAQEIVDAHINRGAIKASERDGTVSMLMAAKGESRKQFEGFLSNLPDNKMMASEAGSSEKPQDTRSATDQIMEIATKKVEASEGKLTMGVAISEARKENVDLAKQADNE